MEVIFDFGLDNDYLTYKEETEKAFTKLEEFESIRKNNTQNQTETTEINLLRTTTYQEIFGTENNNKSNGLHYLKEKQS